MDNLTRNNGRKKSSAIVVGASLSGLMTGIALAREGIHVTILEKTSDEQRTGSGLQVNGGTLDLTKTARLLRKLASGGKRSVQLWSSIESRLRKEALANSNIEIHYNTHVDNIDQNQNSTWVITQNDQTFHGDILIGADGHRSMVRKHISPKNPDAKYAGYIVWIIDTINESELPEESRPSKSDNGVTMLDGINGFLFGSIIDGGAHSEDRQIGCAWYDNSRTNLLRRLGCVKDGVVLHSLKGPDIPEKTISELTEQAKKRWPEPWLTATLNALKTRSLTGIPIKEYVPNRLVKDRIALVGDAAHVPAPITASGFNESLQDAANLGKCVTKGIQGDDGIKALEKYETNRLEKVRQMVQSGESFSRSFGQL